MLHTRAIAALTVGLVACVLVVALGHMPGRVLEFFRPAPPTKSVINPEAPPTPDNAIAAVPASTIGPRPSGNPETTTGAVRITTTPAGANYAIFRDVLAELPPPTTPPLRVGTAPGEAMELPPGQYTIFFQIPGWAVERTGITLVAGEVFPIDFIFPHGRAEISSEPEGAQIFHGERWLGKAPLTVELPLGEQQLVARLSDRPERTLTVMIEHLATTSVAFELPAESRASRAKATPPPSVFKKLGRSVKKVFNPKPTPKDRKP